MTKEIIQLTTPVHIAIQSIEDINKFMVTLDEKHRKLTVIESTEDYEAVRQAIAVRRTLRSDVTKKHKELKKDALEFGRACDAEKNRILAMIEPEETRLKALKQEEDDRKAAIKAEKERIEQERIAGIRAKILDIQKLGSNTIGLTQDQIRDLIAQLDAFEITAEEFADLKIEANEAKTDTGIILHKALSDRIARDEEDAKRLAEAERLEEERKELAKQKAEQDKRDAELAEKQRKIDEANAKIEAEKKAKAEAEERERKEEKAKLEADEKARKEHEAEEAERRVREAEERKAREEALRPDKDKLRKWADEIREIKAPGLKDPKLVAWVKNCLTRLSNLADDIDTIAK